MLDHLFQSFCVTILILLILFQFMCIKHASKFTPLSVNEVEFLVDHQNVSAKSLSLDQEFSDFNNNKYSVIIDCGSSGSRAHIFYWPANVSIKNEDELIASVKPMLNKNTGQPLWMKIRPGLASVRDQPAVASDYMKPLMDFVVSNLPSDVHHKTVVYILGTAGLRLLEKLEQELILNDIAEDYEVLYNFEKIQTAVISGSEEGIYQWISVNAIGDRLNSNYDLLSENSLFCKAPAAKRYGVIEMGGASTQVTFELSSELDYLIRQQYLKSDIEALRAYKASLVSVPLGSTKTVTLFSTTFLGLGSNSGREAAIDLLVHDAMRSTKNRLHNSLSRFLNTLGEYIPALLRWSARSISDVVLDDPCLPDGAEEIVEKPVQLLFSANKSIGFTLRPNQSVFNVKLVGKGNYAMCQQLLNRLILAAREEKLNCHEHYDIYSQSYCSTSLIGTPFVPFKHIQFVALAEFYFTTHEMIAASGPFNGPLVQNRAAQICASPFELLSILYPQANRVDKSRTLMECFKSTWILAWLYTALGLSVKFDSNVATAQQINNKQLDWTLGAAISKLVESELVDM